VDLDRSGSHFSQRGKERSRKTNKKKLLQPIAKMRLFLFFLLLSVSYTTGEDINDDPEPSIRYYLQYSYTGEAINDDTEPSFQYSFPVLTEDQKEFWLSSCQQQLPFISEVHDEQPEFLISCLQIKMRAAINTLADETGERLQGFADTMEHQWYYLTFEQQIFKNSCSRHRRSFERFGIECDDPLVLDLLYGVILVLLFLILCVSSCMLKLAGVD
jgi:hypothetical protein